MTDSVWVVVGTNQWPEDGFGIGRVFESEQEAKEHIENNNPSDAMRFGYGSYNALERPLGPPEEE